MRGEPDCAGAGSSPASAPSNVPGRATRTLPPAWTLGSPPRPGAGTTRQREPGTGRTGKAVPSTGQTGRAVPGAAALREEGRGCHDLTPPRV